ncbi:MAG: exodeoxyribonuclease VII large subunit, partial [Elusimicrobiaceae bacterium]|nr:exodeoxyribonuclease VII large subunit [Elusimicrobiaceae bacterium]
MKAPFDPEKIFSVSEISLIIKEMLEGVFGEVKIEGEISNLKTAASGHIYFDLKDEQALISVVLFRGYARGVQLEEGQKAQISGEISCYIKQGRYQIIAREVATQSKGNLYLEFEKLKEKLTKEGLFDEDKKLPLPKYPKRIGVATSPTGAAIRDILSVLNRRASGLEIIIAPCLVQGEEAKFQIVEAIKNLNDLRPKLDAILVGRGGGSIEDLWAFNEE